MKWYPLGVTGNIEVPILKAGQQTALLEAAGLTAGTDGATIFLEGAAEAIGAAGAWRAFRKEQTPRALRENFAEIESITKQIQALAGQLEQKANALRTDARFCRLFTGGLGAVDDWHSRVQELQAGLGPALASPPVDRAAVDRLPTGGNLANHEHHHLAAGIAEALIAAGIRPTLSHRKVATPKKAASETPYCAAVRVALKILDRDAYVFDAYTIAKAGLSMVTK